MWNKDIGGQLNTGGQFSGDGQSSTGGQPIAYIRRF